MDKLKKAFNLRHIEFEYYETEEAFETSIRTEIEAVETVGIGNSKTLKGYGVSELAYNLSKTVYDKTLADNKMMSPN